LRRPRRLGIRSARAGTPDGLGACAAPRHRGSRPRARVRSTSPDRALAAPCRRGPALAPGRLLGHRRYIFGRLPPSATAPSELEAARAADVEALRPAWSRLAHRSGNLFATPEWLLLWWQHY